MAEAQPGPSGLQSRKRRMEMGKSSEANPSEEFSTDEEDSIIGETDLGEGDTADEEEPEEVVPIVTKTSASSRTMKQSTPGEIKEEDRMEQQPTASVQFGFSGEAGIKVSDFGTEPIDYFNLLANREFYELIVKFSNEYGEKIFMAGQWKPFTINEFQNFLGLLFHTGTIRMNRPQEYWKTDKLFQTPCFSKHTSRNRFLSILRSLHFCENGNEAEPQDRLEK
ncbi:hypothetical protein J437_LFUL012574 [Ladona fulva]|uniref:PiggyBac transposable element-derived protein domain-containing protein n=1 Tax=Ladona fulva TaxID=123851 RepID=A0A8K0KJG2_LADFU|nr:hypothetical protein J437_LFUL012574 [Ladona fulva]